ncbi:MAG: 1-acyl-sn-glycerol-3-phosphate acyltransferase [Saprospiraceae bacterium]
MYRNAPIHPLLRFFYLICRILTWFGVHVFYRKRRVLGRENLKFDGPAIIVVNHPSTLLDVLNPCLHITQEPFFLANYGMFKHPVMNWILTRFFCIPVKRREDVAVGEDRNNDAAFKKSFQHLEKNGLLFIAAEGVSWMERWVRPFKAGAARISLGAEARQNWSLGVKILPVGLSYSAPDKFRSDVIVNFGKPIQVAEWKSKYSHDRNDAINDLTLNIQQEVKSLVLDIHQHENHDFIEQLEEIWRDKFPTDKNEYFRFRKSLIEQNFDNQLLKEEVGKYKELLDSHGLNDMGLYAATQSKSLFSEVFLLILGFPFFLIGYTFWVIPCQLIYRLTRKLDLYIGYDATIKILAGLIFFPLYMAGIWQLANWWLGNSGYAWLVLAGFILSGFFVEFYQNNWFRRKQRMAAMSLKDQKPEMFNQLLNLRSNIMDMTSI